MKIKFLLIVSIFLVSCVSFNQELLLINESSSYQKKSVLDIYKIKMSMSIQEVKAILGDKLVVGYQIETAPQKLNPITIKQPYREEDIIKGSVTYKVLYYYSAVMKPDGLIADDELTPLIFLNGHLVGKGLADLDQIKRM